MFPITFPQVKQRMGMIILTADHSSQNYSLTRSTRTGGTANSEKKSQDITMQRIPDPKVCFIPSKIFGKILCSTVLIDWMKYRLEQNILYNSDEKISVQGFGHNRKSLISARILSRRLRLAAVVRMGRGSRAGSVTLCSARRQE